MDDNFIQELNDRSFSGGDYPTECTREGCEGIFDFNGFDTLFCDKCGLTIEYNPSESQ